MSAKIITFAIIMPIPFQIDLLELLLKGFLIGVIASAPMGPVGVLCIQRTLRKGRWYGFATGVGATVSDMVYALLTGLGMSFAMELVSHPTTKFWLQLVGSAILLAFGIYCWRSDPARMMHPSKSGKGTMVHNGLTAFLLTFSNPLIVFLFVGTYAQLAFIIPNRPWEMTIGYIGIASGALAWWYGITWLVDTIRTKFDNNTLRLINKVIGSVVVLISLLILLGTLFNIYHISA